MLGLKLDKVKVESSLIHAGRYGTKYYHFEFDTGNALVYTFLT